LGEKKDNKGSSPTRFACGIFSSMVTPLLYTSISPYHNTSSSNLFTFKYPKATSYNPYTKIKKNIEKTISLTNKPKSNKEAGNLNIP